MFSKKIIYMLIFCFIIISTFMLNLFFEQPRVELGGNILLNKESGLVDVWGISIDKNGDLYLGTSSGINAYNVDGEFQRSYRAYDAFTIEDGNIIINISIKSGYIGKYDLNGNLLESTIDKALAYKLYDELYKKRKEVVYQGNVYKLYNFGVYTMVKMYSDDGQTKIIYSQSLLSSLYELLVILSWVTIFLTAAIYNISRIQKYTIEKNKNKYRKYKK